VKAGVGAGEVVVAVRVAAELGVTVAEGVGCSAVGEETTVEGAVHAAKSNNIELTIILVFICQLPE